MDHGTFNETEFVRLLHEVKIIFDEDIRFSFNLETANVDRIIDNGLWRLMNCHLNIKPDMVKNLKKFEYCCSTMRFVRYMSRKKYLEIARCLDRPSRGISLIGSVMEKDLEHSY